MRFFICAIFSLAAFGNHGSVDANPLQYKERQVFNYDLLKPEHVQHATTEALKKFEAVLEEIYAIDDRTRTFANTMLAYDDGYSLLDINFGTIYLLGSTSPSQEMRDACHEAIGMMEEFENALLMDKKLFAAMEAYSKTDEAKGLTGYKKRFLQENLDDFRKNGLALAPEKQERLKVLRNEISNLSRSFSRNIADHQDALVVDEAAVKGLDEGFKKLRRIEEGTYSIDLSYPSYRPFMRYSPDGKAREALYRKYNNRAADKNLEILDNVLRLREELAGLLGYKTYADLEVSSKLAGSSKRVMDFEKGLIKSLMPKAKAEYQMLLEAKKAEHPDAKFVNRWDIAYYREQVMSQKYQVDQREVSQYFEIGNVLDGLFQITQNLMGVSFHKVEGATVWHEDVTLYEVREGSRKVGYFYLDLYPRPNKYGHAACFPMVGGKALGDGYRLPVAALVCNFPKPEDGVPALMSISQTETFFHEFGHVLHHVLTESALYQQAGTAVKGDFVEAPSQIFENWVWDYDALKLFARHYKTGEIMPKALFDRMKASKNAFSGINNLRQVFLGMVDMAYHYDYDAEKETTDDVVTRIDKATTVFPLVEGTHFQAGFGHLMGYAANYYGYLFSKVFAADMYATFEAEGVLNPTVGMRYRKEVLAKGNTADPMDLMRNFMGRKSSNEAFARSIGIN